MAIEVSKVASEDIIHLLSKLSVEEFKESLEESIRASGRTSLCFEKEIRTNPDGSFRQIVIMRFK